MLFLTSHDLFESFAIYDVSMAVLHASQLEFDKSTNLDGRIILNGTVIPCRLVIGIMRRDCRPFR